MKRAVAMLALALASSALAGTVRAQSKPVDPQPSREVLEEAAKDDCAGASVVVSKCPPPPADGNTKKASDPNDPLTKSRAKTKAAFDRRDRRNAQDALDGKQAPAAAADGSASRLAPITVTGTATDETSTPEGVIQKALNPAQNVTPAGTVVTYGPDGKKTECIARCKGPFCCKTIKARPDPARESNSIGR